MTATPLIIGTVTGVKVTPAGPESSEILAVPLKPNADVARGDLGLDHRAEDPARAHGRRGLDRRWRPSWPRRS